MANQRGSRCQVSQRSPSGIKSPRPINNPTIQVRRRVALVPTAGPPSAHVALPPTDTCRLEKSIAASSNPPPKRKETRTLSEGGIVETGGDLRGESEENRKKSPLRKTNRRPPSKPDNPHNPTGQNPEKSSKTAEISPEPPCSATLSDRRSCTSLAPHRGPFKSER